MNEAEKLREKFDKDLKELQEACPHPEISEWIEYHWAIGHFSHYVKVCRRCDKIVEENRPKWEPAQMLDQEIISEDTKEEEHDG